MRGAIFTTLAAVAFVAVILVLTDDIIVRVSMIGGAGLIVTALTLYGSRRALDFAKRHPHPVKALGFGFLLVALIAVGVIVATGAWPQPWAVALAIVAFLSTMLANFFIRMPASAKKALEIHDRLKPGEGPGAADVF